MANIDAAKDLNFYLSKYDTFLFDLDGVLWNASDPILEAKTFIKILREENKQVCFISNGSSSRIERFASMGLDNVSEKDVICAADAFLRHHQTHNPGKVLLIGTHSFERYCESHDVQVVNYSGLRENGDFKNINEISQEALDPCVTSVCTATDPRVTYGKLSIACRYITEMGARFYSLSEGDFNFKNGGGYLPCHTAFSDFISTATRKEPLYTGKPSELLKEYLFSELKISDPSRTLMIGDSIFTDVAFGVKCGFDTLLVFSGVTSQESLEQQREELIRLGYLPTHTSKSLEFD